MPSRSIVYLASYPRSGNTFVRTLLANYTNEKPGRLTINDVARFGTGEQNDTIWQALTKTNVADRSLMQQWAARADYFNIVRSVTDADYVFMKTHTVNAVIAHINAFEIAAGDRIIYIVRHPMDTAISAAHFHNISLEKMVDKMLSAGAYTDGRPNSPFEVTGSWAENVSFWVAETRCPVLVVRYDALLQNPVAELRRMVEYLWDSADADKLERAVQFSAFDQAKAEEAEKGFSDLPPNFQGKAFFRSGRSNQWLEDMPLALAQRIDEACGALMEQFDFKRLAKASLG